MIDITPFLVAFLIGFMFYLGKRWADKPMATRLTQKQQQRRRNNHV